MDTASNVCDMSGFQTIGASEIVNSIGLQASVESYHCDSTAQSRTKSYRVWHIIISLFSLSVCKLLLLSCSRL